MFPEISNVLAIDPDTKVSTCFPNRTNYSIPNSLQRERMPQVSKLLEEYQNVRDRIVACINNSYGDRWSLFVQGAKIRQEVRELLGDAASGEKFSQLLFAETPYNVLYENARGLLKGILAHFQNSDLKVSDEPNEEWLDTLLNLLPQHATSEASRERTNQGGNPQEDMLSQELWAITNCLQSDKLREVLRWIENLRANDTSRILLRLIGETLIGSLPSEGTISALEIGGGHGQLALQLKELFGARLNIRVNDLNDPRPPEVKAEENLSYIIDDGFPVVEREQSTLDFFILKDVGHKLPTDKLQEAVNAIAKSLKTRGIALFVVPTVDRNDTGALSALEELDSTEHPGSLLSSIEWSELFVKVGFEVVHCQETDELNDNDGFRRTVLVFRKRSTPSSPTTNGLVA